MLIWLATPSLNASPAIAIAWPIGCTRDSISRSPGPHQARRGRLSMKGASHGGGLRLRSRSEVRRAGSAKEEAATTTPTSSSEEKDPVLERRRVRIIPKEHLRSKPRRMNVGQRSPAAMLLRESGLAAKRRRHRGMRPLAAQRMEGLGKPGRKQGARGRRRRSRRQQEAKTKGGRTPQLRESSGQAEMNRRTRNWRRGRSSVRQHCGTPRRKAELNVDVGRPTQKRRGGCRSSHD